MNETDLQIGLQNLFNIDLRDEQINMIFLRFAFINNLSEKGSNHKTTWISRKQIEAKAGDQKWK